MSEELKPCPFCGETETDIARHESRRWSIQCHATDCICEGPHRATKREAVAAWNQRVDTAIPKAEADAMVAAARRDAAYVAAHACLVEPDGGSPTPEEIAVCDEASKRILARTPADARAAFEKAVQEAVEVALQQATLFCTDCGHPVPPGADGRGSCGHGRVMQISTLVQHKIGGKND